MNKNLNFVFFLILTLLLTNLTLDSIFGKIPLDSDTIAEIAGKISPSVVNIDTSSDTSDSGIKKKTIDLGGIELHIPETLIPSEAGTGSGIIQEMVLPEAEVVFGGLITGFWCPLM